MNALCKNKRIKSFVAEFNKDSHDDVDTQEQDAIDDLVVHVSNTSDTGHELTKDEGAAHDDEYKTLRVFFHNLSICVVLHTHTHQIPTFLRESSLNGATRFRRIFIVAGTARGNTSSLDQYLAYCYYVGVNQLLIEAEPLPVILEMNLKNRRELYQYRFL